MSQPNPNDTDAILGGQNILPVNAAVLGGLAGVKQCLENGSIAERLQALNNAVAYDDDGIDLAIRSLSDNDDKVRQLAKRLLRDRFGEAGKKFLLDCDLIGYFITLDGWKQKTYYDKILDPDSTVYIIEINVERSWANKKPSHLKCFKSMIKDPNASKLEALFLKIDDCRYNFFNEKRKFESFRMAFDSLAFVSDSFKNLKYLQISEDKEDWNQNHETREYNDYSYEAYYTVPKYKNSNLYSVDFRPLLKLFPNLEYLNITGNFHNFFSSNNPMLNDLRSDRGSGSKLKTLIIDDPNVNRTISALYPIELPNLEYIEIWFNDNNNIIPTVKAIGQILAGKAAPKLKYLSLCNCQMADDLVKVLIQTPIIEQLAVLDLKMGAMTSVGVRYILDCSKLSNLRILNVSNNCINNQAVEQLRQLPFKVITDNQYHSIEERDNSINRYSRSYE